MNCCPCHSVRALGAIGCGAMAKSPIDDSAHCSLNCWPCHRLGASRFNGGGWVHQNALGVSAATKESGANQRSSPWFVSRPKGCRSRSGGCDHQSTFGVIGSADRHAIRSRLVSGGGTRRSKSGGCVHHHTAGSAHCCATRRDSLVSSVETGLNKFGGWVHQKADGVKVPIKLSGAYQRFSPWFVSRCPAC